MKQYSNIKITTLVSCSRSKTLDNNTKLYFRGVQAFHFGKKDFDLGVGEEGQNTSRHFDGSFESIRVILPI